MEIQSKLLKEAEVLEGRQFLNKDGKDKIVFAYSYQWWWVDTKIGIAHWLDKDVDLMWN